jgi:hypothetical protein
VFPYTSKAFNNTFKFNNEPMDQAHAEETCKCQGGHLVSYISPAEQNEIEKYFIDQASLSLINALPSASGRCCATAIEKLCCNPRRDRCHGR